MGGTCLAKTRRPKFFPEFVALVSSLSVRGHVMIRPEPLVSWHIDNYHPARAQHTEAFPNCRFLILHIAEDIRGDDSIEFFVGERQGLDTPLDEGAARTFPRK